MRERGCILRKRSNGYQKPGFLLNLPTILHLRRFFANNGVEWRKNPVSLERLRFCLKTETHPVDGGDLTNYCGCDKIDDC